MPDEEVEALARELGAEPVEPPKPSEPPKTPDKGDEPSKDDQPPKGEEKGDDGTGKGETPADPLAEYASDPEKALQGLLEHPKLGPMLNQWADRAARAQVEAEARKGPKAPTEAEVRQKVQEEREDKFFSELTKEQLDEEIAKDPSCAAAYGKYQLRQQEKAKVPSQEDMDQLVAAHATASLIVTFRGMVDDSDLSDEQKAELQPEKFQHLGRAGMPTWGKAIYLALVQLKYDTEWASELETRRAEDDKKRPGSGGGRPPGSMFDLMTTDSSAGLEAGLAAEEKRRTK